MDSYTELLWEAIKNRLVYTDLSASPCAFSEAPAEDIFSIYERICKGRESLTIEHLVALTRLAAHGPPVSTKEAEDLAQAALANFQGCIFYHSTGKVLILVGFFRKSVNFRKDCTKVFWKF